MAWYEPIARLAFALALGSLIGVERQYHRRAAGKETVRPALRYDQLTNGQLGLRELATERSTGTVKIGAILTSPARRDDSRTDRGVN